MRLIDANALKKPLVDWLNWYRGSEAVKCIVQEIVEDIDNSPTIEAEPIRHARWEHKYYTDEEKAAMAERLKNAREKIKKE